MICTFLSILFFATTRFKVHHYLVEWMTQSEYHSLGTYLSTLQDYTVKLHDIVNIVSLAAYIGGLGGPRRPNILIPW